MRINKAGKNNKRSRLTHFQMIPLVLSAALVTVYVAGMGSFYTLKGKQTAESLSITYDYDSDKASEYSYLTQVSEDLSELTDLAGDKKHALKMYVAAESIAAGNSIAGDLDETLSLIREISTLKDEFLNSGATQNTDTGGDERSDADAKLRELLANLRSLRDTVAGFEVTLENDDSSAGRYAKKIKKNLLEDSEKLLESVDNFLNISADPEKSLMEDGDLAAVKTDIGDLQDELCTLPQRLTESVDLLRKADERIVNEDDPVHDLLSELASGLSDCVNAQSDQVQTMFVSLWKDHDSFETLQDMVNERIADGTEDAEAARIVADNNANYNQRCRLSRDMKEERAYFVQSSEDTTYRVLKNSLVRTVSSSDKTELFGPLPEEQASVPQAWTNVLGSGAFSDFTDNYTSTRLLLDCYKEDILPEVSYNIFKGLYLDDNTDITVTISDKLQSELYDYLVGHGIKGDVFAYDYNTGDILCMVSTEKWSEDPDEINLMNINLRNTSPGSTMKIVTLFLLESEGVDPAALYYDCDGKLGHVTCSSNGKTLEHGYINGVTAIAESCNIWFAQAISEYLMVNGAVKDSVRQTLTDLGYQIVEDVSEGVETCPLGKLKRDKSVVNLDDNNISVTTWNLIGQDTVEMSPVDMAQLSGLYAGSGKTAAAKIIRSDETSEIDLTEKYGSAFTRAMVIWKQGYEEKREEELEKSDRSNYTYSNLPECVTAAKTGTTQLTEDGDEQRLLSGFSEKYHLAFYIVISNYRIDGIDGVKDGATVATVATELFDKLEETEGE